MPGPYARTRAALLYFGSEMDHILIVLTVLALLTAFSVRLTWVTFGLLAAGFVFWAAVLSALKAVVKR
jgi:hypothetical protein